MFYSIDIGKFPVVHSVCLKVSEHELYMVSLKNLRNSKDK